MPPTIAAINPTTDLAAGGILFFVCGDKITNEFYLVLLYPCFYIPGTLLTLTGANFGSLVDVAVLVLVGTGVCTVQSVAHTQLVCLTPAAIGLALTALPVTITVAQQTQVDDCPILLLCLINNTLLSLNF